MEWLMPLIGGLGIGAILKSVVDFYLTKRSSGRKLKYEEMKDAYIGLLNALHEASVAPSDKASKNYALWPLKFNYSARKKLFLRHRG